MTTTERQFLKSDEISIKLRETIYQTRHLDITESAALAAILNERVAHATKSLLQTVQKTIAN